MKAGVALPLKPGLKFDNAEREPIPDIGEGRGANSASHTDKVSLSRRIVNTPGEDSLDGHIVPCWDMTADRWPQRENFKKALREFADREGIKQTAVAGRLGISLSYMRNNLYAKDKRPSVDILTKAALLFDCPITDFVDGPGVTPSTEESPVDRHRVSQARKILTDKDLSESERQILSNEIQAAWERLKLMKANLKG